jgi:hypothetical protein
LTAALAVALSASARADAGKVLFHCPANDSQRAAVDPLEYYGVVPSPHEHTPAGALAFSSISTVAQMLAAPTSCELRADHSMVWIPTPLTPSGRPAAIESFDYYYYNDGYRIRRAPPDGLRFMAGDPHCTGQYCPAIYICRTTRGPLRSAHTIPTRSDGCDTRGGGGYEMVVYSMGQCWDGVSLGQGMGASTPAANITMSRPCRGQAIPGIILAVTVGADGIGGYLSSDIRAGTTKTSPGSTGHFDYVFGWKHTARSNPLMAVINQCLDVTGYTTSQVSCTEVDGAGGASTVYRLSARTGDPLYDRCVTGPLCTDAHMRVTIRARP